MEAYRSNLLLLLDILIGKLSTVLKGTATALLLGPVTLKDMSITALLLKCSVPYHIPS